MKEAPITNTVTLHQRLDNELTPLIDKTLSINLEICDSLKTHIRLI